jgi:hypothetical protein
MKFKFSGQTFGENSNTKCHPNLFSGSRVVPRGLTDDKASSRFSQFFGRAWKPNAEACTDLFKSVVGTVLVTMRLRWLWRVTWNLQPCLQRARRESIVQPLKLVTPWTLLHSSEVLVAVKTVPACRIITTTLQWHTCSMHTQWLWHERITFPS